MEEIVIYDSTDSRVLSQLTQIKAYVTIAKGNYRWL